VGERDPAKKIAPELLRQLDSAEAGVNSVQAVFSLRPTVAGKRFIEPKDTDRVVKQMLQRVQRETGTKPEDYHVFPNLGSFVIAAPAQFLRRLLEQKEIASAIPNRVNGGGKAG
jgi:hypothetical protein